MMPGAFAPARTASCTPRGIRNGVQGAGWVANLQHADARARFLQLQDKQTVVLGELVSC